MEEVSTLSDLEPKTILESGGSKSLNENPKNLTPDNTTSDKQKSRSFFSKFSWCQKPMMALNIQNDHEIRKLNSDDNDSADFSTESSKSEKSIDRWKRILLLVIAITVHNIPEGMAVGVAFAAIGSSPSATFDNAR